MVVIRGGELGSRSRRPAARFKVCLIVAVAAAGLWWLTRHSEPSWGGKSLSEWLLPREAEFVGYPNDVYGHIHDELKEDLEAGPWPSSNTQRPEDAEAGAVPTPDASESERAVRAIGTNAIPALLRWMAAEPTALERFTGWLRERAPRALGDHFSGGWAARRRWAAHRGIQMLGPEATPALPALNQLLHRTETKDRMLVAFAIDAVGPDGTQVLREALGSANPEVRWSAALALGCGGPGSQPEEVVVALLDQVRQGRAEYQVLGAIGRLRPDPRRVGPVMAEILSAPEAIRPGTLEEQLAVCLAGLCGPAARETVPALVDRYRAGTEETRLLIVAAIRHIDAGALSRLGDEEATAAAGR